MSIIQIVYVSKASRPFNDSELQILLQECKQHNSQAGITGVLLHCAGFFMQLIEGADETITTLYDKIAQDSRHLNVKCLTERQIESRSFPDWDMALLNYDNSNIVVPKKIEKLQRHIDSFDDNSQLPFDLLLEFITPDEP